MTSATDAEWTPERIAALDATCAGVDAARIIATGIYGGEIQLSDFRHLDDDDVDDLLRAGYLVLVKLAEAGLLAPVFDFEELQRMAAP